MQKKKLFKEGEKVVISEYLDQDLVVFLQESSRDNAIKTLIKKLSKEGKIEDENAFYEAVIQREKIVSTGIGMGVAIPHAKLDNVKDFFIVIGIEENEGISWKSLDGSLVKLIFLIGGPASEQTKYLRILSRLTSIIKDESVRQRLLEEKDPLEIINLFQDYEAQEA